MLFPEPPSSDTSTWKRINMRNVEHLLAVEFIHDLYNRHDPLINSVRFRHTVTTWKNGIVNSYAPQAEWEAVGEILGWKYYCLDNLLLKNTKSLYCNEKKGFHAFLHRMSHTNLDKCSNEEILSLLVDFQSVVLGQLYVVNFVQVEHGLTYAIKKIISEHTQDLSEQIETLSELIKTEIPTASEQEKMRFSRIARKWRIRKKVKLYSEKRAKKDIETHWENYGYLYSAYGELPKPLDAFWCEFKKALHEKETLVRQTVFRLPSLLTKTSRQKLKKLNDNRLDVLVPLLVQGGIFRDTNKAMLGMSLKHRFALLDTIARRTSEARNNLDYYTLYDIKQLLLGGIRLEPSVIYERKHSGVTLVRSEDVRSSVDTPVTFSGSDVYALQGVCASRGTVEGIARIVTTNADISRVVSGDILVAIGTDFNMIDAMHRSGGIITEEGGILSHAAVICRESGIPCLIGVDGATRRIADGQRVVLDASAGTVRFVS